MAIFYAVNVCRSSYFTRKATCSRATSHMKVLFLGTVFCWNYEILKLFKIWRELFLVTQQITGSLRVMFWYDYGPKIIHSLKPYQTVISLKFARSKYFHIHPGKSGFRLFIFHAQSSATSIVAKKCVCKIQSLIMIGVSLLFNKTDLILIEVDILFKDFP